MENIRKIGRELKEEIRKEWRVEKERMISRIDILEKKLEGVR